MLLAHFTRKEHLRCHLFLWLFILLKCETVSRHVQEFPWIGKPFSMGPKFTSKYYWELGADGDVSIDWAMRYTQYLPSVWYFWVRSLTSQS